MSDFLACMAVASRDRVRGAKRRVGEAELVRAGEAQRDPAPLRHDLSGFDVIAEFKLRTPSGGLLAEGSRRAATFGAAYARGGACSISVLTEPTAFSGSLETLNAMARHCGLPTMRKDFLVEPYQVIEARVHGASGVLLIARLLHGGLLDEMIATATSMKLFALVEAFDLDDLERAVTAFEGARGSCLLGVNARNLTTLAVDPTRHAALARRAPAGGIGTPEDAGRIARLGYDAALVGEALMRAGDPAALLTKLIASGRESVAQREVTR